MKKGCFWTHATIVEVVSTNRPQNNSNCGLLAKYTVRERKWYDVKMIWRVPVTWNILFLKTYTIKIASNERYRPGTPDIYWVREKFVFSLVWPSGLFLPLFQNESSCKNCMKINRADETKTRGKSQLVNGLTCTSRYTCCENNRQGFLHKEK